MGHHWIIITASAISNKWCHLSILLVTGSSTEFALFHACCRTSLNLGLLLQSLYHPRKAPALTSTAMVGHTYYHPGKGPTLKSTGMVGHTYYHPGKGSNTYIHWHGRKYLLPSRETPQHLHPLAW